MRFALLIAPLHRADQIRKLHATAVVWGIWNNFGLLSLEEGQGKPCGIGHLEGIKRPSPPRRRIGGCHQHRGIQAVEREGARG